MWGAGQVPGTHVPVTSGWQSTGAPSRKLLPSSARRGDPKRDRVAVMSTWCGVWVLDSLHRRHCDCNTTMNVSMQSLVVIVFGFVCEACPRPSYGFELT